MPIKCITPGRAGVVIGTAAFVMLFNVMFLLPGNENCGTYHLNRVLVGPEAQDDPKLLRWMRSQMVPPSRLPYNLSNIMNGFHLDIDGNELPFFSPSQEFILDTLQDLLGDKIKQPGTFLEAGAYDGEFLSNTLWLELSFGWKGILVEANPTFFQQLLLKRRKSWAANVCLNTKPYPSKEKFMVASPGSGDINHLLNSATTDPRIETHIGQGSSGLAEFLENDTKILAIEHPTKDDLAAYLDERGYRHVASKDGDHIFLNKADLKLK